MAKKTFVITKTKATAKINLDTNLSSYNVVPKNKIKVKGTIEVSKLKITDDFVARQVILRKLDKKIKDYLAFIISADEEDGDRIDEVLNEVRYYRSLLEYKYIKYLEQASYEENKRLLEIVESELELKKQIYTATYEIEETRGKSR